MKIRNFFCCNSSSQSFILYGIKLIKSNFKLLFDNYNDPDFNIWEEDGKLVDIIQPGWDDSDTFYVGRSICNAQELEGSIDIQEVLNDKKIQNLQEKLGYLPNFKLRLYYGERET